jgi:lipoate-protein ligase A
VNQQNQLRQPDAPGESASPALLDATLPTPAENLACDEALLDEAEAGGGPGVLRFWEPEIHFVVLGYAGRAATEVNIAACQAADVPILRRCSGGGTVLQGPGCLNYSLVLPIEEAGSSGSITGANRFVMERNRVALAALLGAEVRIEGHTDLALAGRKFSGNAQRRRKRWLLFHGTFLVGLDLPLVEKFLQPPSRQPDYRRQRSHSEFLTQLPLAREKVKNALCAAWDARAAPAVLPWVRIGGLVAERYSRREWNLRW